MLVAAGALGWFLTIVVFGVIAFALFIGGRLGGMAARSANDLHEIRKQGEKKKS